MLLSLLLLLFGQQRNIFPDVLLLCIPEKNREFLGSIQSADSSPFSMFSENKQSIPWYLLS